MLVRSRKGSLFALFSPKLWTVLNQYGAGGPCVMGVRERSPGIEFENLSLDQFKLEDAACAKAGCRIGDRSDRDRIGKGSAKKLRTKSLLHILPAVGEEIQWLTPNSLCSGTGYSDSGKSRPLPRGSE